MSNCIGRCAPHYNLLVFEKIRDNILNTEPEGHWQPRERGNKPAVGRQTKRVSRPSGAEREMLATEGSTNRQRPRLLLGRSVCYPRSNVACQFFKHQLLAELSIVSLFFSLKCPSMFSTARWPRRCPRIFRHAKSVSTHSLTAKVLSNTFSGIFEIHDCKARIIETDLKKGPPPPLRDTFGRVHNYLRISACSSQPLYTLFGRP